MQLTSLQQEGINNCIEGRSIKFLIDSLTTVDEFLSTRSSLVSGMTKHQFLGFRDQNGISNNEFIYSLYPEPFKSNSAITRLYLDSNLSTIFPGTTISIPISNYSEELVYIGGKNLFLNQDQALKVYFTEEDKKLKADPLYVKLESLSREGSNNSIQLVEENCQVLIYVKSIDKLIDISPFINSLTTSKSDVGSFNINLNPIEIALDRDSDSVMGVFISKNNKKEYLNQYEIKDLNGIINFSFFEKYCQQNDAVFIRFEKLQLEEGNEIEKFGSHNIEVDRKSIPSQVFDMIGLVDSVSSIVNGETTDYSINISGRDLMKVLIEDGSYLMDIIYSRGAENTFYFMGDENDTYFKRNYANNGAFEYLFKEYLDPIKTYMGFIINQLSNIGWTGENDLFDYYPESDKSKKYDIAIQDRERYLKEIDINGVWKIIHLKIDPSLEDRRVVDGSFIDQDGTLYEQFKKVCQDPFVEFWGDTYGSQFNLIARQQPFDKKGMKEILETPEYIIDVETKDTYQVSLGWETEFYSWFQFFPNNEIFGNDKFFLSSVFPIVYLEEYVKNFGNHRKVIQDNYVFGSSLDTVQGKENKESLAKGLFNDLKYVIERDSVLPFTRRGTILINGDRRIKRGSFIRLKATGEICYVDAVSNTITFNKNSINRQTVLNVSRCMFEQYLIGIGSKDVDFRDPKNAIDEYGTVSPWFNYYDIVNTDVLVRDLFLRYEGLVGTESIEQTTLITTKFGVNREVFDFFLKRKQMDIVYE